VKSSITKDGSGCSEVVWVGDSSVMKWVSWGQVVGHFEVFVPVAPLVKEFELPMMGGGVGEGGFVCTGRY
jgi:hypothetical protein